MRIILFTGKGGVGKTTIAAATALKIAQEGKKTLVISTDPAHSLSDALNLKLGAEPTYIAENLYGQELDVYYSMKKYWGNMRNLMLQVFKWQGVESLLAEELSALPGMEEASAFLWLEKYYSENAYDVIIIDSAPTGETLTLLTLPQVTKWWVTKAFPFQKLAVKAVGSVIRNVTGAPVDYGFEELENLLDKLEKIQQVFTQQDICSIRIVANPERMVIQEAKRAFTYLQLYGYSVDAVVVNRVLPEESRSAFGKYLDAQAHYLKEIEESFSPLPILTCEHIGQEVFGLPLLEQVAGRVYGDLAPDLVMHHEDPFQFTQVGDAYHVAIRMPFVQEGDYTVQKIGDELVIQLLNKRKNLFLPKFTHFFDMAGHHYEAPWLTVKLHKKEA
jgi:arsenite-transporting ATPase